MQSLYDLWELVVENLKNTFSEVFIKLWIADLKLEVLNDSFAVLVGDSDFKCKFVRENHVGAIKNALEEIIGYSAEVIILSQEKQKPDLTPYIEGTYVSEENQDVQPEIEDPEPDSTPLSTASEKFPPYHTQYTFDNFITGNSNKFAYEACIAVSNSPANQYNPLFIYGPSGLGKTHLLYAINNRILERNPNANIVYIKGEDFANQLIENINKKSNVSFRTKFREKFRQTDILLIDDIHFIAGKEATQEEVFNTFNALYENGKQIILTSDRPPREIKTLEERLRSRFEGGLIADIQPPDYELRSAIIQHKSKKLGLELPPDIIDLLAENLRSNVRQIEGALTKLHAYTLLGGRELTYQLATECISDILSGNEPVNVTLDKIFDKVTRKYGVTHDELKSKLRIKNIAKARHICIYIIRKMTKLSTTQIAHIFYRDHSTIMSSLNIIEQEIHEDSMLELEIDDLIKEIRES